MLIEGKRTDFQPAVQAQQIHQHSRVLSRVFNQPVQLSDLVQRGLVQQPELPQPGDALPGYIQFGRVGRADKAAGRRTDADHMHIAADDMIALGFLDVMGWRGKFDGDVSFVLDEAMTPLEIARDIEKKTGVAHCRIIGKRDGLVTKIGLYLGHRGGECWNALKFAEGDVELAIGGEWCEWADGEPIRDAAEFGLQRTAIMMGHAGSERDGMRYLAKEINRRFKDRGITAEYVECGELYTYTDSEK